MVISMTVIDTILGKKTIGEFGFISLTYLFLKWKQSLYKSLKSNTVYSEDKFIKHGFVFKEPSSIFF